MHPLRFAGAVLLYAALVFGAGFAFAVTREASIEPQWGVRNGEIAEALVMVPAILLAGCIVAWIFRRAGWEELFVAGIVATLMVGLTDVLIGAEVRGLTSEQLLFKRDSLEGAIYYGLVGLAAIAPALFSLRRPENRMHDPVEEVVHPG